MVGADVVGMAPLFVLIGSILQAYLWGAEYQRTKQGFREAQQFSALMELWDEVPWWKPVQRRKHRREFKRILKSSPDEYHVWLKARYGVSGWMLIIVGTAAWLVSDIVL